MFEWWKSDPIESKEIMEKGEKVLNGEKVDHVESEKVMEKWQKSLNGRKVDPPAPHICYGYSVKEGLLHVKEYGIPE